MRVQKLLDLISIIKNMQKIIYETILSFDLTLQEINIIDYQL